MSMQDDEIKEFVPRRIADLEEQLAAARNATVPGSARLFAELDARNVKLMADKRVDQQRIAELLLNAVDDAETNEWLRAYRQAVMRGREAWIKECDCSCEGCKNFDALIRGIVDNNGGNTHG